MLEFDWQTGGNLCIPFSKDLKSKAKADIKEHCCFNELQSQYKCTISPSDPQHGYNLFAKVWDQEVGQCHLQVLAGDDNVILIHPKSVV
jgi:hypothetical protein